jgi:hypothetical protein
LSIFLRPGSSGFDLQRERQAAMGPPLHFLSPACILFDFAKGRDFSDPYTAIGGGKMAVGAKSGPQR